MDQPLRAVLAYLLATAVFLIILITAGVFDPKPVGELQATLPATRLTVDRAEQTIHWLDIQLPDGDFSVRGTAEWQDGNPDSGIGLAVGSDRQAFVVAVSPLGYVLVKASEDAGLPWQPWPHVRLQKAPNEIWLDVRGDEVTVRLNRELLWQGNFSLATRKIGYYSENFGEAAVYAFSALDIFAPEPKE